MLYAFFTVLRQPERYIPAILTVGMIGALLLAQLSLLHSALKYVTLPIEKAGASVWTGYGKPQTFENPRPMSRQWEARVSSQAGVASTEIYLIGLSQLKKRDGTVESCVIVGSKMSDDAIGTMSIIPNSMRAKLSSPGAFACYDSDLEKLRLTDREQCEISGQSVYFVGSVPGKQYTAPYLLCSIETAEKIIPGTGSSMTSYVLATCRDSEQAAEIAGAIGRDFPEMESFTQSEMSSQIRRYILFDSRTGLVIISVTLFCVAIAILVMSQTLYSVTAALRNEFAVLDALGISLGHLSWFVLGQSLFIGVLASFIGVAVAQLATMLMSEAGLPVEIEPPVYLLGGAISGITVVVSALVALRSLRQIEPAELLH